MIEKVRKSLNTGATRIKWIATFLAERTKAETSIVKLLYESSKLENKIDDIYRDIGKRVTELKEKNEKDVFKDFIIQQALNEIKNLREAVIDYKRQAKDFNKLQE